MFHLFEKLTKSYGQTPYLYSEDPRESVPAPTSLCPRFMRTGWARSRSSSASDRVLMGSDYPHVEGLADPASYIKDLENFSYTPEECERVMRHNGIGLSQRLTS